jgi:uncharacterized protein (DUF433 family)
MSAHTERNKKILGGTLIIKGTRVPVSRILYLLSKGTTIEKIIKTEYPHLTPSKIKKALEEAADKLE